MASTADHVETFESWKASLDEVEPGVFRVDEDMRISGAALRSYFDIERTNPQALTVLGNQNVTNVWPPEHRFDLAYCVADTFGSNKSRVVEAMAKATRAWQIEAGAGLAFRYASANDPSCTTANPNVRIAVTFEEHLPNAFGDSDVGPRFDGTRPYANIRLSPASFDAWQISVGTFGVIDLAGVAAHELGHAIGFLHEHDNPLSGGCAVGALNFNDGNHKPLTGYDPASIMHYRSVQQVGCTSSSYAWLTKSDRDGARIAYPPTATTPAPQPQCLNGSYGRGAGTPTVSCAAGQVKDGALCYAQCKPGFYGVGPVCWQSCPAGYRDDGAFCRRDASIISSNNSACPWYDKCGVTLAKGCSTCPAGYTNDGCTCRKDASIFAKANYGRGAGSPLACGAGKELDAGLCYTPCSQGYKGAGPVCREQCQ